MQKINKLTVKYHGRVVGTLALYQKRILAFEYDEAWLVEGFSISPFSLPLERKVFIPKIEPLDGTYGVFADSLPDGWGRLLVDRVLLKQHVDLTTITNLNRLAIVGASGMGALTYEPCEAWESDPKSELDYDKISSMCKDILQSEDIQNLDDLFSLGGSSGGARPKIFTKIDGEDWIIKFPSSYDTSDIGLQEYRYSLCAKACGIEMSETRLFESKICAGYFGTKRFDRTPDRIHMVSVAGLLETSHRIPNLDYDMLMKLTLALTDDFTQVEKLYRWMCFNVFAHNRDDHSKNFSFLYAEEAKKWIVSPAYDLTYSNSIGGEHATMIHGNGSNPSKQDVLAVADYIGMNRTAARQIAEEIETIVREYRL
ncbi:MAG: type II toxin-antitoxin system HipA family toxin [Lachnospiraceae bacterium]